MISSILYFLTLLGAIAIALLFYKSKDGALRKHLIAFFSCLSLALLLRGLNMTGYPVNSLIIITPFCISTIALAIYLYHKDKN